jgi:aspartyl aminopeptidase
MENRNSWELYSKKQLEECEAFSREYIDFLSSCKTERECTERIRREAEEAGYRDLDEIVKEGGKLSAGSKVYRVNMGKGILLYNIGEEDIENGMNILGAHIDSPRLDVKQNPLYEDGGFAYFDTHYYGGIKKYQWVTLPLALHGVFAKKNGEKVDVRIGEDPDDPVFFVSDLLIHLAQDQMKKSGAKVIDGEDLDLVIGNMPAADSKDEGDGAEKDDDKKKTKDKVKERVLAVLKEKYGVEEEDLLSAELEIVPAGAAREAGFDRSMILSYGQDDRVCAFSSYKSMLGMKDVKRTACCILVDKEEIGSVGATGMQSKFFENTTAELIKLVKGSFDDLTLRRCLASCTMLSSDVSSAYDPLYARSFDRKNVAYLGNGIVLNKFTGARGKSGSNDANAEYIAAIRNIFAKDDVNFQMAELGKVDLGGGGTIAYIMALYGMNVIDSGVPVLSMHSPWEATSKADVYEAKRGYDAFLKYAERV